MQNKKLMHVMPPPQDFVFIRQCQLQLQNILPSTGYKSTVFIDMS